MQRLLLFGLLPFCSGCLAFGYPSITATPSVSIPEAEVRAFKTSHTLGGKSIILSGGESVGGTVEQLPLEDGRLGSLSSTYFAYYAGSPLVTFSDLRSWNVLLYRPGYQVIEIPSRLYAWNLLQPHQRSLDWKPATTVEEQIAALEAVCPESGFIHPTDGVRRFLAAEYARLAGSPLERSAREEDLIQQRLRRYASP